VVKAYPAITWNLAGMQPLRAALVACGGLIHGVGGVCSSNSPLQLGQLGPSPVTAGCLAEGGSHRFGPTLLPW